MKRLNKAIGLMTLVGTLFLTGCGNTFEIEQTEPVETAGRVAVSNYVETLDMVSRPWRVNDPKEPEPGLYDAMCFMSVDGFSQIKVLNENEYFTYDLLTEADFDELDRITEPTNVNVKFFPNGYSNSNGSFSCFVYRIEEDYIYLGTAGHCIEGDSKLKYCELMFYDRVKIRLSMLDYVLAHGFTSKDGDYAMYRVPTSLIPKETLLNLKEVRYDPDYATAVKSGDYVYSGNIYARKDTTDYDIKMRVYAADEDFMAGPANQWNWMATRNYILTKGQLIPGQSGSGFFDYRGYLVGIASGTGTWDGTKYSILTRALYMEDLYNQFEH